MKIEEKYINGLSIIIPSYNRKNQLLRILNSIFKEDTSNIYEIVVIDNNSDYNIYSILDNYPKDKLRIVLNPFNVQMSNNIMNSFVHCKTKWMWMISDDDIICEGSIDIINKDITNYNYISYLKYSIEGIGKAGNESNVIINNLSEFFNYYLKNDKKQINRGNLVFMSNGIFNLEKLTPYLGKGFQYSYTFIPHLIPVFFALKNGGGIKYSENKIVKYLNPGGDFWSYKIVGLGLSTISHLPLNLSKNDNKKFLNITMPISFKTMFSKLLQEDPKMARHIYSLTYNNSYRFYLSFFQKFQYFIFSTILLFPNVALSLLKKVKKLKGL